jgi:hypothetical protein
MLPKVPETPIISAHAGIATVAAKHQGPGFPLVRKRTGFEGLCHLHSAHHGLRDPLSWAVMVTPVPTEPVEPTTIENDLTAIHIDEDHRAATNATGNPLWSIPLKELSATRERPIFSPSRRPPRLPLHPMYRHRQNRRNPSVHSFRLSVPSPESKKVSASSRSFGQHGAEIEDGRRAHKGWILHEVRAREIVMAKGDKTETFALPVRSRTVAAQSDEDKSDLKRSRR